MRRPVPQRGQHGPGGDGAVVVDEPPLGAAGAQLREVHLVRVGQPDRDPVDVEFLRWRCHLPIAAHQCRNNVGMHLPVMPPVSVQINVAFVPRARREPKDCVQVGPRIQGTWAGGARGYASQATERQSLVQRGDWRRDRPYQARASRSGCAESNCRSEARTAEGQMAVANDCVSDSQTCRLGEAVETSSTLAASVRYAGGTVSPKSAVDDRPQG